ncbi:helix-turn-helix domain-containing protein [Tenacibaculum halocynthiae]|uniref:helix-turn-helix domain-containing protein n=1 Tax=Tenacibaculum halocynthiae TaxID=1254437 RepID=UPI003D64932D
MAFSSLFLFFFGAIGVFNSFFISLYFIFYKKSKILSNKLFGFFLFFLSERAFRSLIYFFSDITPNAYSKFGPVSFLFIGPFLFLYVLSITNRGNKIPSFWKHHILFWVAVAIIMYIVYPFRTDPIFYKKYILKGINIQWLIYLLLSIKVVYLTIKNSEFGKEKITVKNWWLSLLLTSILLLWCIYFWISFTYFVVGSIVFSAIFYSFFIFFLFKKKEREQVFYIEKKYLNKKMDSLITNPLIVQLKEFMDAKKPFKNPNLKSSDIANELSISTHQLSQLLNDSIGKSFSNFVNEYRVEEAKQIISSNTKYTLDAIGKESGFNSKSTFYTYFKRVVGVTPSKYREQL